MPNLVYVLNNDINYMFNWKRQFQGVSQDDSNKFESLFHCAIPSAYLDFLKSSDGGIPSPLNCVYHAEADLAGENEFEVSLFFSLLSKNIGGASVSDITQEYIESLPPDGIIIGSDDFGNFLGLRCDSNQVFWTCQDPLMDFYFGLSIGLNVDFETFISKLRPRE